MQLAVGWYDGSLALNRAFDLMNRFTWRRGRRFHRLITLRANWHLKGGRRLQILPQGECCTTGR
jgi:hypothetical protein